MSSMWSLSEDIQADIFLRLPVNSILACRCVCKPLCSLLSKPSFIKNHLNLTIQSENPRLMFGQHSQYDQYKNPIINSVDYKSVSSLASDFSEVKAVSMQYPFENIHAEAIVILGSCNGLICMGISQFSGGAMGVDKKRRICIWNPSTGEYSNVKVPVPPSEFLVVQGYGVKYGFGYDRNIEDYKLVRISGYQNHWGNDIAVYMLGSNCWKTIQCTDRYVLFGHLHKNFHGVLINGVLHWSGALDTTKGTCSKLIVCFDINNERLMDVPFPEEQEAMLSLQKYRKIYRQVGALGDCLCVVYSVMGIRMDIWVMQDYGVRESWTKVFTTTHETMTRDRFFKPIWCFENGEILVHSCGQLSLFAKNGETSTRKVLFEGINMSRYPESYVESLVSLNSKTYVKKKTTKRKKKKPKRQRKLHGQVDASHQHETVVYGLGILNIKNENIDDFQLDSFFTM